MTQGSSPLARGLHSDVLVLDVVHGIIPARAGFTAPQPPSQPSAPDHPRSRGVYQGSGFHAALPSGSSPLARGLHRLHNRTPLGGGIIPARAGFTHFDTASKSADEGSSPLARGLLADDGAGGGVVRIIPARAGFTCAPPPSRRPRGDHPRSRGVYVTVDGRGRRTIGSSPLARGLLPPGVDSILAS